uniref:Uncharacterized protein n=1 Tax=uncultured marine virus TaxID=186617 RepID=A0A0F7L5D7_9VIRU|nr:hypothetical protein [uncultured marine virus]
MLSLLFVVLFDVFLVSESRCLVISSSSLSLIIRFSLSISNCFPASSIRIALSSMISYLC